MLTITSCSNCFNSGRDYICKNFVIGLQRVRSPPHTAVHLFFVAGHRRITQSDQMAPKKEKAPPPSSKPAKSGGGKQKKKKWSKGKQKEKVNNMVLFDKATYDKLLAEAPKFKLITPSILSDRLRINGSLARKAIKDLMARGAIRMVSAHASQQIYTRATNT
ncbi:hypothetical protein QVD17_30190 [Tagetes erecta]|uniref:40S ribosomal protein S25 n=2 Tax=Heliantheae alliance TaxID=911341 RepID=A0AAD8K4Z2_TARER|nr:hypothetical protein QVD17_30190 [Tagetes erecta]